MRLRRAKGLSAVVDYCLCTHCGKLQGNFCVCTCYWIADWVPSFRRYVGFLHIEDHLPSLVRCGIIFRKMLGGWETTKIFLRRDFIAVVQKWFIDEFAFLIIWLLMLPMVLPMGVVLI